MQLRLISVIGLLVLSLSLVALSERVGSAQGPTVQSFTVIMGEGEVITEAAGEFGETEDTIIGEFHRWEPNVLVVHRGDVVRLTIQNPRSTVHSFSLRDFGVVTADLEPRGGEATVEFVAERAGSFTYACATQYEENGFCALDHRRQTGTLLVLER